MIFGHVIAAIPFLVSSYVGRRLWLHREWLSFSVIVVVGAACFLFHPTVQTIADNVWGYRYAKAKEALAIEHRIVGKNFSFVVERLGEPKRVRVESPVVTRSATREITRKLDTYQAMDYYLGPGLYTATRFIVFLDELGNVKSHRVKWEHGEGR